MELAKIGERTLDELTGAINETNDKLKKAMENADRAELTTDQIIAERGQVHGDFTQDASTAQQLKQLLRSKDNWEKLSSTQKEALEMICTKLGRIMVGDPKYRDHWSDIAGYARLVETRL